MHDRSSSGAWLLVLLVLAAIFALSSQPDSSAFTEQIFAAHNHLVRRLAHLTEFLCLFLVLRWALARTCFRQAVYGAAWLALLLTVGYACLDEWHQSFVPGRTASIDDVLIDALGAVLGCACWLVVRGLCVAFGAKWKSGRRKKPA